MVVKNTDKLFPTPWLADKDIVTGVISKVLKCYSKNDISKYEKFEYCDNGEWVEASDKDIKKYGANYYLIDGTQPYDKIKNNTLRSCIL